MRNWAGNVVFGGRVHRPSSVSEVRRLVAGRRRVRALGSGHSFNRIADTDGDLVLLDGLPPVVELGPGTVSVAAGVRYTALARRLHAVERALPNLASLPHLSVVGACATATHGSGVTNGSLSTAVRAVELVTAEGDLATFTRDDREFDGVVVSLGALGVITRLTLDTVPAFTVRQRVYLDLPFEALTDNVLASGYSVSLFTTWRAPRFDQVWVKRRDGEPDVEPWPGAVPATSALHPIASLPASSCTTQLGVPGPWHERLPHFRAEHTPSSGDELQSEYFVPRRHLVAAVTALHGIRDRVAPLVQVSEVRTVAADGHWLSPCHARDSAAIHFTWLPEAAAVTDVLPLVEDTLAPFEPRPHWAKLFHAAPAASYQRLADFRRLRASLDPAAKFTNDFIVAAGLIA
jgi:alditol oxidase